MIYQLLAIHRNATGVVSPPIHKHLISAEDETQAVRLARAFKIDLDAIGANALFLADERGMVLWSQRSSDAQA
jgi:hypothetical protein